MGAFCQAISDVRRVGRRVLPLLIALWGIGPAESVALTAAEVLLLKQNGVSEETIQMMIRSERQARQAGDRMGVAIIRRADGKSAIVYSTGDGHRSAYSAAERRKEERAWEMLRRIIVDARTIRGHPAGVP